MTILVYKNITFFFIVMKGLKWLREREKESKDSDCYHWHCVGDINSELYFFSSLMGGFQTPPPPPLNALQICLTHCMYLCVNVLSVYNIINAYAFSFQFSNHVIYFCYSFVYTGAISCLEIHKFPSNCTIYIYIYIYIFATSYCHGPELRYFRDSQCTD